MVSLWQSKSPIVRRLAEAFVAIGVGLLVRLLERIPLAWFSRLGGLLSGLVLLVDHKDRRILRENVERVLNLQSGSHLAVMFERQVFRHQITSALETVRGVLQRETIRVEGLEEFRRALAGALQFGRGAVLISGHLGSWELSGVFASQATARRVYVVAKPSKSQAMTKVLDGFRRRMGVEVLWTGRRTLLQDMGAALEGGDVVGCVMDQRPESRRGVSVNFLGWPTSFVGGPALAAVNAGCPVLSLHALRVAARHYRIEFRQILPADHKEASIDRVTQLMATEIEREIRLYPEQWAWNYRRWKWDEAAKVKTG